uniref:Beta-defensin n=1 Tax=Denticeps clupeoides TaxID=299321 RepID=A0AAY4A5C2_9TELE
MLSQSLKMQERNVLILHLRHLSDALIQSEAISFPWSCASLNGLCRQGVCLPSELYFGPLGCGKGFLCCVSHFL